MALTQLLSLRFLVYGMMRPAGFALVVILANAASAGARSWQRIHFIDPVASFPFPDQIVSTPYMKVAG